MNVLRYPENPLIKTRDVKPSREDFKVVGAFNAGVTKFGDETVMLIRVAEMPKQEDPHAVLVPLLEETDDGNELVIKKIPKTEPGFDFSDPRVINHEGKTIYLTSISHLRLARSRDGRHFEIDTTPTVFPENKYEAWGIEDCRITSMDEGYFITYSAVSDMGIAVGLIFTRDFSTFQRKGLILPPENKDVMIFPEKINGRYYLLHRPVPGGIGEKEMWIAASPDLRHWGDHKYLMGLREEYWDSQKIGGGAVPFRTDDGWVAIYHGVDENERYCMGAVLLDLEDPTKVIARSERPMLIPEADYEADGFFGNVVFSCGVIVEDDVVKMYYGAADEMMACAEISIADIFASFA
ncbi:MAG TPA: glycoside hydrolase family 130 protein [Bacillales bacterium]|nr:glycoside hydrolase family 130 protein [Bacillales bacterium]